MARETYAALQAKIEKEINKLQKKAEVLQTKRRKPVISSIIASMREYDITPKKSPPPMALARSPLVEPPAARPAPRPPRQRRQTRRCAKYRHPQTGETWSGRGKAPVGSPRKKRRRGTREFSHQRIRKPIL